MSTSPRPEVRSARQIVHDELVRQRDELLGELGEAQARMREPSNMADFWRRSAALSAAKASIYDQLIIQLETE